MDNSLILDYKTEDNVIGNKAIKTFDEIIVNVICVDTVPMYLKCFLIL